MQCRQRPRDRVSRPSLRRLACRSVRRRGRRSSPQGSGRLFRRLRRCRSLPSCTLRHAHMPCLPSAPSESSGCSPCGRGDSGACGRKMNLEAKTWGGDPTVARKRSGKRVSSTNQSARRDEAILRHSKFRIPFGPAFLSSPQHDAARSVRDLARCTPLLAAWRQQLARRLLTALLLPPRQMMMIATRTRRGHEDDDRDDEPAAAAHSSRRLPSSTAATIHSFAL